MGRVLTYVVVCMNMTVRCVDLCIMRYQTHVCGALWFLEVTRCTSHKTSRAGGLLSASGTYGARQPQAQDAHKPPWKDLGASGDRGCDRVGQIHRRKGTGLMYWSGLTAKGGRG